MLPRMQSFLLQKNVRSMKHLLGFMKAVDGAKCKESIVDPAFTFIYDALEKGFINIL